MCGIAGIFEYASSRSVNGEALIRMRDTMVHRGPDGAGIWLSPDGRMGLAHRRLAIVDLSEAASQPMCNEDQSVWVTFNGEIYNHVELRKDLLKGGHIFKTDHCDTEVIVHGYEEWGVDGLVSRMDGDFAIGLWDLRKQKLFLIRDRIGVKPLYFSNQNGRVAFASEIKALFNYPGIASEIDLSAMQHYLTFLTTPAPSTMFKGIAKVPAGYLVEVSRNGLVSSRRYWDALPGQSNFAKMGRTGSRESEAEIANEITRRLSDSVSKRMMSDVPIGVLLSGGIDSSTNVAMMSAISQRPVETFTVGFKGFPEMNEFHQAQSIAKAFGTNHHEIVIDRPDMEGYIKTLVRTQDEPLADWVCIPLYFVSRLARQSGVTVVQVGEGSDEEFSGYGHYLKYAGVYRYLWKPLAKLPKAVRQGLASGTGYLASLFPALQLHAEFMHRAAEERELFWGGSIVYWDCYKRLLLQTKSSDASDAFDVVRTILQRYDAGGTGEDFLNRMIYLEFKLRLPELLLMRVDKITMSTSLEARVPYLDHRLVELAMDIPGHLKISGRNAKHLLKKAVAGLIPRETIARKKMGFDVPMSSWLRGEFGREAESRILNSYFVKDGIFDANFIRNLFLSHRAGHEQAMFIWVLFNLVEWYQCWFE
jgi:asparagine synthase (glutamine-hydrolysing)